MLRMYLWVALSSTSYCPPPQRTSSSLAALCIEAAQPPTRNMENPRRPVSPPPQNLQWSCGHARTHVTIHMCRARRTHVILCPRVRLYVSARLERSKQRHLSSLTGDWVPRIARLAYVTAYLCQGGLASEGIYSLGIGIVVNLVS